MYDYKKSMMPYDDSIEIDVKNIIEKLIFTVSKYWLPMVLSIIIICELAVSYSAFTYEPEYAAYVTYVVNKSGDENTDTAVAAGIGIALEETFETSGLKEMIESCYKEKPDWLNTKSIVPTYDEETNLLTLTVSTNNYYNTKSLFEIVQEMFPQYASQLIGTVDLSVIDQAEVTKEPANPYKPIFNLEIGIFIGIFLCGCFIAIASAKRKTIRRKEDMKSITSLKCLEEIPLVKSKRRSKKKANNELKYTSKKLKNTVYGQSMQVLRQKVEKTMLQKGYKSLMITSSIQGEGKSTVSANLAISLAQRGYKVILVDGDLYHPVLTEMFHLKGMKNGLVDYLNGETEWSNCIHECESINLFVGREKKAVSSNLLLGKKMQGLLTELKEEYDFIIVDTPPSAYMADAGYLSKQLDAMLYVVRHDYTDKHLVEEGLHSFNQDCADGVGYVLNAVDNKMKTNDKYSYRKYGYKSYSLKEK